MELKVGEIYYDPRRLSLVSLESLENKMDGSVRGILKTLRTNFQYSILIEPEMRIREAMDSDYIEFLEFELLTFDFGDTSAHISKNAFCIFQKDQYVDLSVTEARELLKILNREING